MVILSVKLYILGVFGTVCITILSIWLTIIIYRLNETRKRKKKMLLKHDIDTIVRFQNIYSLETARNKDIFLFILIIVEIVSLFCSLIIAPPILNFAYSSEMLQIIDQYFPRNTCILNNIVAVMYIYPASVLFVIFYMMLVVTQLMLISYINRYIAARYFGYSLAKRTIRKYIFCWIFVGLFQVIFCIRKLQIFLLPSITIVIFLNWCNLVITSRKMCSAIQSKLKEIRLFEWNPTHSRQLSNNLKFYKRTIGFIITSFLFVVLLSTVISIWYPSEILLLGDCYMHKVYNLTALNFNFNQPTKEMISKYFKQINQWIVYALEIISIVLLLSPSVYIFTNYLANYLYNLCTGRGNINKLNKVLFDPLLES